MAKKSNWMKTAVENPGSLRETAKHDGLIKGNETLTKGDIKALEKSKDKKTAKRARLADVFYNASHKG